MTAALVFDTPPPCPEAFNLAAHALAPARHLADRIALAIVTPESVDRWSYGRLLAAVMGTAGGLGRLGLEPGARVLLRIGNTVDFPIAFLGCIAAGLVPVPTSTRLAAPEIADIAAQVTPALALYGPGVPVDAALTCPLFDPEATAALRNAAPGDFAATRADDLAYLVFTSGTSGRPRAVMHAHRALWARQMMHAGWYGLTPQDRVMHAGAFNWTYTLGTGLLDPWSVGATALIPGPGADRNTLPLLLARHDATIFAAAPGVFRQILGTGRALRLPALRHGLAAGEKLPESVRQEWYARTGTAIHEAFGMSECSTFISASPDAPAPPGSLGRPQPGRRVAILGSDGLPVARGTPGLIAVHESDPGLMLGYWGAPEETAARFRGAWFVSGDLGSMDAAGWLSYLGRDDDMMNAGGFRVSPLEVEAALAAHEGIAEAAAAEVAVKSDASVIAAFYSGPEAVPEAELAAHCAARLAAYKCPRLFVHLAELPRNPNGKLLRKALARDWAERAGKARA